MLEKFLRDFLDYRRITKFADKSIESYRIRLREFNKYLKTTPAKSIKI